MADSNIGALPQAPNLDDDSLMVVEQQGTAMKMTGGQFKEFGRQGVRQEVQDLVDAAQSAADSAVGAMSSVVDMTVEAETLGSGQSATVKKSMKAGKVNLLFGLPRGEQGEPGPEGKMGPRGPRGDPGSGLKIKGYYDTPEALEAAQPRPEAGDAYGVGVEAPYDIYVFDGAANTWKNNGPLSGGGGGVVPENVVTSEGGASFEYGEGVGAAPHVITFTYEEEPPLTAQDVAYDGTQSGIGAETVQEAVDRLFTSVSDGKRKVASAITDKGVPTAQDAAFEQMAANIGKISTGTDTGDATAGPEDILYPKTAYAAKGKVTGQIPSLPAQTITPGTANKTIANGQYLSGTQTIRGDANLTSANIKKGVSIFGVAGALESAFKATLTVKVEAGAQVTAKCGDREISALSTTGTVVMELPAEGKWSITAARGMTQYNTAIIDVTSSYSAELTAEIYIEFYGNAPKLSQARYKLAGVSTIDNPSWFDGTKDYALFAGGNFKPWSPVLGRVYDSDAVDAYDEMLTHTVPMALSVERHDLAAAAIGPWVLFGGGNRQNPDNLVKVDIISTNAMDAYNPYLTRETVPQLSEARGNLVAASVGDYALFGGGKNQGQSGYSTAVEAYSVSLVKTSAPILASAYDDMAAQSTPNGEYALFACAGTITAYDKKLVRSTPAVMSVSRTSFRSATAGNYTLFAGGFLPNQADVVDAYDLFLTRTNPQALSVGRNAPAGTTLGGFGIFTGGGNPAADYQYSGGSDVYDAHLVRTAADRGQLGEGIAAASIGKFALFAGGARETSQSVVYLDSVSAFHRAE